MLISLLSLFFFSSYFLFFFFFFFNDTATTEIYTLSLHDALPIFRAARDHRHGMRDDRRSHGACVRAALHDRSEEHTSDSSHGYISYAVFCLKKKKNKKKKNKNQIT